MKMKKNKKKIPGRDTEAPRGPEEELDAEIDIEGIIIIQKKNEEK